MTNVFDKKNITLVLTEECNFRCKYCYMVKKNNKNILSFDVAKKTIDYLFENRDLFPEPESSWDFIGGEPLLEVELIDQIIKYIKLRSYQLNHPWFESSWFSMSSNGSLFGAHNVQELLRKHGRRLEIGMTIDGPEHIHDMERVFVDGRGTHSSVVKNVPLWLKQFSNNNSSTKVTISRNNLPYLAESVLYLFSIGIAQVNANVVFENVWESGDDDLLEQQLNKLGDTMLETGLWKTHSCSFFNDFIGKPLSKENDQNWCGSGHAMVAVDAVGNFYPCVRFLEFSLAKKPAIMMGNIYDGFDTKVRDRFVSIKRSSISPQECMECEVASGCAWCPGFNYDNDEEQAADGIGKRAIHICKMHKARVRANNRYQEKLKEIKDLEGPSVMGCKDGKCESAKTTGKVVGKATKEETSQIKQLFLRREALADLFLLLPEMDTPDGTYEQIIEDTGKTMQAYNDWWDIMSEKYKWESGGSWQINFESGSVSVI